MSHQSEQGPCRICTNVTTTVCLTTLVAGNSLGEMLRYCTNLEINEYDCLPYQCCSACKFDLIVAYKLIQRCHKSDVEFRKQLERDKFKTPKENEDDSMLLLNENMIKTEITEEHEVLAPKEEVYAEPLLCLMVDNTCLLKTEIHIDETMNYNSSPITPINNTNDSVLPHSNDEGLNIMDKTSTPEQEELVRCCKCKINLSLDEVREHSLTVHKGARTSDPKKKQARPYECDVCFKRYTTENALRVHRQLLYIENGHKCDNCDEYFKSKELLTEHKESHAKELVPSRTDQPRCCACYEQFDTHEELKQHVDDVHLHESLTADDKDKQYQYPCDLCHRRYKSLRTLRDHQLRPYRIKPYQCATCGRIFRDKTTMVDHEQTHQGEQVFICPVCNKSFLVRGSFRKHVHAHSLAEDRFKCESCGKGFKTKGDLKKHSITHSQERTFQCSLCPASFARKISLTGHTKLHTGEKPHKCDQCDAAYTFLTDLRRHIMAHQGIKPFVCNICGRAYPRRDYLRRHMTSHGEQG